MQMDSLGTTSCVLVSHYLCCFLYLLILGLFVLLATPLASTLFSFWPGSSSWLWLPLCLWSESDACSSFPGLTWQVS